MEQRVTTKHLARDAGMGLPRRAIKRSFKSVIWKAKKSNNNALRIGYEILSNISTLDQHLVHFRMSVYRKHLYMRFMETLNEY